MKELFLCILCFGSFPLQSEPANTAEKRTVTIDDYFSLQTVSDPQLSPDGAWVAYVVSRADLKKDKYITRIWMVSATSGETVPLTLEGVSASKPRWSPDNKYLTFLADRNDSKTQLWALNRLGGEAVQWSKVPQGIKDYTWAPDGKKLALVIKDARPEDLEKKKDKPKPRPWVVDRLQIKRDYEGYMDHYRTHIYLMQVGDTTVTRLTGGDFDDSNPVFSPDAQYLAFVSNRSENPDANDNTDIWLIPASPKAKNTEPLKLTQNPGADGNPAWSPDGRYLCYESVTQPELIWYATTHLAVTEVSKKKTSVLTKTLDRHIRRPRFSADGKYIWFELEDAGQRHLARFDMESNKISRSVSGPVSVRGFSTGPTATVAVLLSRDKLPQEIFLLKNTELRQLTFTNRKLLQQLQLSSAEKIRFESRDGTTIEGFLYKPAGYQKRHKYPALLRIHGGPVGQFDYRFNFDAQLFAANGYAVVLVNPRGSSGYGQEFSLAIWRDWGNKDFDDVMAGIDHVIRMDIADPQKLGVGGWSYGGMLTDYVITKTDRFKAAISGASEVLYVANYGTDHYQYEWEAEMGLPWEKREDWEKISPFNQITNVKTPTLVMGGEKDWNVPVLNSEQLYQALRRLGVPTELVVYPGEHHGIRRPSFQRDRYQRYLDWYAKYLQN